MQVLNFYSRIFADQLKRGRKTATIRLGDKSAKYIKGQVVWITVGHRHAPREKIFAAAIDDVEVKRGKWSFANLPVIPPHFDVRPIPRSEERLKVLGRLITDFMAEESRQLLQDGKLELKVL